MYSGVALSTAPRREREAWCDGVAPDSARPVLRSHGFRQQNDPGLGSSVGGTHAASDEAVDRGSVDDRAASARQHVRDRVLAAHELAFQVDGDKPVENRHVEGDDVRVNGVGRGVGRVVVQHVKAAERLDCGFDHAHDARLVRDVDLGGHGAIELAGHALGLSPVDIGDHDRGAFARHQTRSGLADAAAGACDDRDLVLQASHVGFTITLIDSRSFIAR
jgi:hypothetical protein